MAFIFVSGIARAAPTAAWARSARLLAAFAILSVGAAARATDVEIQIQGLRNTEGTIHLCLSRSPAHFPDCSGDPQSVSRTVPAAQAASIRLHGIAPGDYAIAVIHDANANGRLDTFLGIPREGFGFSRNPRIHMGPPSFEECRFPATGAIVRQVIAMKYLL